MPIKLAIYSEKRDLFVVSAEDIQDPRDTDMARWRLKVLRVLRNEPTHGVQYNDGDTFDVSWRINVPSAMAWCGYELDFIDGVECVTPESINPESHKEKTCLPICLRS